MKKIFFLLAVLMCSMMSWAQKPVVTLPEGLTTTTYVMTATDYGDGDVRRDVKVAFDGNVVYMQGLSEEVPTAWVRATISGREATFDTPQTLGTFTYNNRSYTQYLTGADTSTGDVSDLIMIYDPASKSFNTYSNNWILLSNVYTEVGYYYQHLYNSVSLIPASEAGEDPNVTPPATLSTADYQLIGYMDGTGIFTDYNVKVGFDGDDVYVQGIYPALPTAWIKGTIDGDKVRFVTPQYVGSYHGLYQMYVEGIDPLTSMRVPLVMNYDASRKTFATTPDCYFLVQCGEEELMPMMLLENVTMEPAKAEIISSTLVTLPEGYTESQAAEYEFSAIDTDTNQPVSRNVRVLTVGKDVYMQGLSEYLPEAWVRGTFDQNVLTFRKNQFMGSVQGNSIYLGGGDVMSGEMLLGHFFLLYDAATGWFLQPSVNYLVINASVANVYHLENYNHVKLTPLTEGISTATTKVQEQSLYSLSGQRINTAAPLSRGLYIRDGKKVLVK